MNINALEFRLLEVFSVIMRERSVTQAADSLGLTQPAISQGLRKLRQCLDDPLFVRTAQGVEPTPRAMELSSAVSELLQIARERLGTAPAFDPSLAKRMFSFYASDGGAVVFTPPIAEKLQALAPGIRIRVLPIVAKRFPDGLESGEADLALGFFQDFGTGFYQQRLYEASYVCLVRANHTRIRSRLTRKQFIEAQHLIVSTEGTGHAHAAVEKILTGIIAPEQIGARVPSFLAASIRVAHNDYVLTLPESVGRILAEPLGLRMFQPPLELPRFEVKQYWHERFHRDPANRWFRDMIASIFSNRAAPRLTCARSDGASARHRRQC